MRIVATRCGARPLRKITTPLLIFLLASAAFAQVKPTSITQMDSGLTVILQEDHTTELVGIEIWIKTGIRTENATNNGISHFIEHLVFAGTSKRQAGQMDCEMESVGATLDAFTGADYTHYGTTVDSQFLSKALEIFADAINDSQFREEDIERERKVILDEIARKQSNPRLLSRALLAERIYGKHPYSMPLEGTPEIVKKLTRADLLEYYRQNYIPSKMAVVLVGDFESKNALAEIDKLFQKSANPKPPNSQAVDIEPLSSQINETIKARLSGDYIAIGFPGPRNSDARDVCAADVLADYFGSGHRSWISEELRAKTALAGDANVDFVTQRDQGLISFVVSGTPDDLPKIKDAIMNKLAEIGSRGLSSAELELAKRTTLGQSAYELETVSGRANAYGFYFALSDAALADTYQANVKSLTNADIIRTADKYLNPDRAVILTLGPNAEASK